MAGWTAENVLIPGGQLDLEPAHKIDRSLPWPIHNLEEQEQEDEEEEQKEEEEWEQKLDEEEQEQQEEGGCLGI